METNIIYKYRAPHAPPGNETTLTAKALDLDSTEALITVHQPGETISLEVDDPVEYGRDTREYVVLDRYPLITQWVGSGAPLAILLVVVTDADV